MRYIVIDIEADNLLDKVSKIHCLSYQIIEGKSGTLVSYKDISEFVLQDDITLIGHNAICYDIPALEKVLGIVITATVVDTLALSWYLFARRDKHGLETWGVDIGVPKVKIDPAEWAGPMPGETQQEFIDKMSHRCTEDVSINTKIYLGFISYLDKLYPQGYKHLMKMLTFKMNCLKNYETNGITFNSRLAEESKYKVEYLIEEKITEIKKYLPKVVLKTRPKKTVKKDGTLSATGIKWRDELRLRRLPINSVSILEDGNPGAPGQLKVWITTLGWKPKTFKPSTSKKPEDEGKMIPQLSLPFGGGICPSVKDLYVVEPSLVLIEGLFMLKHRMGLFKSFLEKEIDGKLHMGASSFTNTMRWQHRAPLVNIPSVYKAWGKELRGCLTVPNEEYVMFGADISGLEDNTKYHYMYYFDPEYVKTMLKPGFDGHLDIAIFARLLGEHEVQIYKDFSSLSDEDKKASTKEDKDEFSRINKIRSNAKTVNFGGLYGIGAPKLAENLKIPLKEAKNLHKAYWERNKAVKQIEKKFVFKTIISQTWIYNPVSTMWVFLKNKKDIFSTLNQNTGSFVFSLWLKYSMDMLKEYNIVIPFEYHDELLGVCKVEQKEIVKEVLQLAMDKTNKALKLNVTIKFDVEFGKNYSECH